MLVSIYLGYGAADKRRESAVVQFEQFLRARAESERTAMLSLGQSNADHPSAETSVVVSFRKFVLEFLPQF